MAFADLPTECPYCHVVAVHKVAMPTTTRALSVKAFLGRYQCGACTAVYEVRIGVFKLHRGTGMPAPSTNGDH